jgi:hypothetical protein
MDEQREEDCSPSLRPYPIALSCKGLLVLTLQSRARC